MSSSIAEPQPRREFVLSRTHFVDAIGVALLSAIVVSITYLYVSRESTFYTSDYGGYQAITQGLLAAYQVSLRAAIGTVLQSINDEYNALFAIPLVPFLLLFGDSRLAYETALAVVYMVPFTVTVAAIAKAIATGHARSVFWTTAAVVLLTPMVWVPTLRGYPDVGGAFLVCLAIRAYLADVTLGRQWQLLVIGIAAALSMLLRRHFAYDVFALFAAMAIHACVRCIDIARTDRQRVFTELRSSAVRIGCTGAVALAVVLIIGRAFLYRGLTNNYIALYAAYMSAPDVAFTWFASTFGWIAVIAAAAGWFVAWRMNAVEHRAAWFVLLFSGISAFAWLFIVRQTGEQYTLHFALVIVLGLASLVAATWPQLRRRQRVIAALATALIVATNLVAGLTAVEVSSDPAVRRLFAMKETPLRRTDRAEVSRMVAYLREIAGHHEPIYVAASSVTLSAGLVIDAERTLYGRSSSILNVMYVPQIDSRDSFPLEQLLPAQFVVTAEPFQQHMGVHNQRVVKAVHDIFTNREALAVDFERLPHTFQLDNRTLVTVYKRTRRTALASALKTFRTMERGIQTRPGGQLDWMALTDKFPFALRRENGADHHAWLTYNEYDSPTPSLLFVGSLTGLISVSGEFDERDPCAAPIVSVASVNQAGESRVVVSALKAESQTDRFNTTFATSDPVNVLLTFTGNGTSHTDCAIKVKALRVSEHP